MTAHNWIAKQAKAGAKEVTIRRNQVGSVAEKAKNSAGMRRFSVDEIKSALIAGDVFILGARIKVTE